MVCRQQGIGSRLKNGLWPIAGNASLICLKNMISSIFLDPREGALAVRLRLTDRCVV